MKILLLVDCYYPAAKSSAKLIHDLAIEFRHRGHDATVLAPSEWVSEPVSVSVEEDVRVIRVKTPPIKGQGNLRRALGELSLSRRLWTNAKHILRENPCDLVLFYSPTIFFGALVRRLKKLWRCPAYLLLRDIFPEWAVNAGLLRRGLAYRYFKKVELDQYRAADVIAVESPGNLNYFRGASLHGKARLTVLYNWTASQQADLPRTDYRGRLKLHEKTVFFYGGNLGRAQDAENLLRLILALAPRPDLHFVFAAEGSGLTRLEQESAARGLTNLHILPPVKQQEYLSMVAEFDVGLLSLDRRLTTHNLPGKFLSYLYAAKPVLASVNPGNDIIQLMAESRCGYCCVNGDDESLLSAALLLAGSPDLRRDMGQNARKLLDRKFTASAAAGNILHQLQEFSLLPETALPSLRENRARANSLIWT
ncbi:MAG TPA: glycosyltransferase family 4 protein [Candidatus Sulfotelmatobacter sp.]|nr:glycosyltransferase family 4 protein [Candidatus Sulfotelmatobacter sp.]